MMADNKEHPPILTEDVALFSIPPVNVGEDKIKWVEQLPTFMSNEGYSSVQFYIPGSGTEFTDLSRSELYVKLKVVDNFGDVFKQSLRSHAIPIDNVLHSLWSSVDIKLNQFLVGSSGTNYMYKALIENLLNYNAESRKHQMETVGFTGEGGDFNGSAGLYGNKGLRKRYDWFKLITRSHGRNEDDDDESVKDAAHQEDLDQIREALKEASEKRQLDETINLDDTVEEGEEGGGAGEAPPPKGEPPTKKRRSINTSGPTSKRRKRANVQHSDPTCVEFMGPLLADICNQERLILNGVNIDIKLWPNRDEFRIFTFPDGVEAKIIIEDIKLFVCKVKLSDETYLGISEVLKKSSALYPYQKTQVVTKNVPAGSFGDVMEDMFQGKLPSRMIVGMVNSEAYAGHFQENPYWFHHFDLASMGFYVDNEPTPSQPFELDFTNCGYLQGMLSLYRVAGKLYDNTDIGINRDNYRQGYCMLGFEIDPTSSSDFRYIGKEKAGRTRLKFRFKKALPVPITLIVYAVFPEIIQINNSRAVSIYEKEKPVPVTAG